MNITGHVAVIAALLGSPALAQSAVESSGHIAIANAYSSGSTETYYEGDLNFGGSFLPLGAGDLGFDFGATGVGDLSGSNGDYSAYYPALTYTVGSNKVSLGLPRSSYDTTGSEPDFAAIGGASGLAYDILDKSSVNSVLLLTNPSAYGVRYDGGFGMVSASGSYHRLEEGGTTVDAAAVGGVYHAGKYAVFGGYEAAHGGGETIDRVKIGGSADFGQFSGGISYNSVSSSIDGTSDFLRAYASFDVTNRIGVTVDLLNGQDIDTIYGISGKYVVVGGAYVAAGFADSTSADSVTSVSIGFDF